jgi:hypothetical protein
MCDKNMWKEVSISVTGRGQNLNRDVDDGGADGNSVGDCKQL